MNNPSILRSFINQPDGDKHANKKTANAQKQGK